VNPTEVPIRRVKKAQALEIDEALSDAIGSGERVFKSLPKIAKYVMNMSLSQQDSLMLNIL